MSNSDQKAFVTTYAYKSYGYRFREQKFKFLQLIHDFLVINERNKLHAGLLGLMQRCL